MGQLSYVIKRLKDMNYKAMFEKINSIHKKTGMSRIHIFNDMRHCALAYGAGYMDYDLFEMYDLTEEQRSQYLTRGRNNALVVKYCDPDYMQFFMSKAVFNGIFGDYLKRDWLYVKDATREEICAFLNKHETFMAKPVMGGCGRGIEKLHVNDFPSMESVIDYVCVPEKDFLLEEVIIQHEAVNAINPYSINTVRLVTLLTTDEGESYISLPKDARKDAKIVPHVIVAFSRIGNGKRCVDNFNSGGMCAPVDVETGTILEVAIDKNKNVYTHHPETGSPIKGFTFPDWEKAKAMCLEAALRVPEMGYVGWDIGFTPNGPILVEANEFPGHDIYQLPVQNPERIGMMPRFDFSYMKKDKQ